LALLNAWKKDLDNPVLTDAFSGFVAETSHARGRMEQWMRSKHEWVGRAGWLLLARLARTEKSPSDAQLTGCLRTIERDIQGSKNRVRDAMNSALISIGSRNAALEKKAIAAARKIGKVVVDHGETGCKTPDAEAYILKTRRRQRVRAAATG
jgi:3-methyladenine DNA glycosylase AlkD